jgi:sporulation protein YlmC with PRC-barrel domain
MMTMVFASAGPWPARSQTVDIVKVDVNVVAKGYRTSRLIGTSVKNEKNETVGSIDDIVIDKNQENQALYAVLQVGGFLSLGGRLVAVKFDQLQIEDDGRKIKLPGATEQALRDLTEFHYGS